MEQAKKQPKLKNGKKTFGRLFRYIILPHKWKWLIVLLTITISALAGVYSTTYIETLINEYITPLVNTVMLGSNPSFAPLITSILTLAGISLVGIIATVIYGWLMVIISQKTLKNIRDEMFAKMQKLPVRYFDSHTHGDIMSRYTNDTDTLEQLISQTLPNIINSLFTIVFTFASMLYYSIYLTIIVVVTLALMMLVVKKVGGKSGKHFVLQQKCLGKVNGYIEEMLGGQKVIKVFCHEDNAKADFKKLNEELCYNANTASKYANMFMPIMGNIGYLQYVLLAIVGGAFAIAGVPNLSLQGFSLFNIGVLSAFLLLSKSFSQPVTQLSSQVNSIIMAMAGAERIFEFMDEEPELDEGYVTLVNIKEDEKGKIIETNEHTHRWAWRHPHKDGSLTYTEMRGDIVMENVDFGYVPEKTVLHDVSVYAKPGQKVAFVGSTGAGKTTITNLLNRFYDISKGKIRYDGININKIKKSDLRKAIGIVLQDTNLFTGTVKDNIRYGRLDATDEEIFNAAKLANADDFIQRLPDKYDTMLIGNGENLSQGQRQLLAIARAAVADTPVMIMDEATSSIDTRTERLVQEGTDLLMHGRTVFVIAHRLSTIHNSNVIMVLEKGVVIEKGTHEDLIAKKGKYYQLYTGKFELD